MTNEADSLPVVTVGIPTFNRPEGLTKTLRCIAGQSYSNLDIVVSDNASPDPEGIRIAREFANRDSRIRVFSQKTNVGPLANFEFVLAQAQGDYFMWAADDDNWQEWFIEKCVTTLGRAGPKAVAAITEAQYFTEAGPCDFFFEGAAFHGRTGLGVRERLELMLDENYGNLFYSVFRRDALFIDGLPIFSALGLTSLNEISVLLCVASRGDWIVLPDIGIGKQTRMSTYRQARWEKTGGRLPKVCRATSLASIRSLFGYHASALSEIMRSLRCLKIPRNDIDALVARAKKNIWRHFLYLVVGYKAAR